MVAGYYCQECGYKDDCNVAGSDSDYPGGQRLCPECDEAIGGITGERRSGPEYQGNIDWILLLGYGTKEKLKVSAHNLEQAVNEGHREIDDDEVITEAYPEEEFRRRPH